LHVQYSERIVLALWSYRRFIWDTAVADLRYRYAGSTLGVLWNVVSPLAMLALYTFIFGNAFAQRTGSSVASLGSFVFYLAAGFLPWGAFADCVARGTSSLVTNAAYLKKISLPEQVFVAQAAMSAFLNMLIVLVLLIGFAFAMGQPPQLSWLVLPVVAALWQTLGFGLGLVLGVINVFLRDVTQIVAILLQIWMWSVPVVYLEEILPGPYRQLIQFNPAYPFVRTFREAYLGTLSVDNSWPWSAMIGWAMAALLVGFIVLHRLRSEIRDVL
jgi:lipopolysaccharide transport system permease protein